MPPTPDSVIRTWFDELWNQGKEETINRLFAPDAIAHGLGPDGQPLRGPEAFKPFFHSFHRGFPDIQIQVVRTINEGEMVVAHCHVTGTHQGEHLGTAATRKAIDFWGVCIARVRDGQIVEAWNCFDFLTCYQQIGVLPQLPA